MASFVIRNKPLALLTHHPILLLGSSHDALDGVIDLIHRYFGELTAGSENSRLVEEVGQISAGVARGAASNLVEVHILGQGLTSGVDTKDLQAAGVVGTIYNHLAIKTAWAH